MSNKINNGLVLNRKERNILKSLRCKKRKTKKDNQKIEEFQLKVYYAMNPQGI